MNLSVFAIALLSLGSVLATPPFLKDKNQCEELGCCATTTVPVTTTTVPAKMKEDPASTTTASTTTASTTTASTTTGVPVTTTTDANAPTNAPTTTAPTCHSLNCETVCGGDDGGDSSGSHQILSMVVMAAGFFLSFLM